MPKRAVADRDRHHIVVPWAALAEDYTSYREGRGSPRPPSPIDRHAHGQGLAESARRAELEGLARRAGAAHDLGVQPASDGLAFTFDSVPGFQLELTSLDPLRQAPELLAVQVIGDGAEAVERATVRVPDGKLGYFLKRFEQYVLENTPKGNPRNANLVERIANVRLATIEALWTDRHGSFPARALVMWWEVWLRATDGHELERLAAFAARAGIEVGERHLIFDNRVVVLVRAAADQLATALDVLDDIAELRGARTTTQFFRHLTPADQAAWTDELVGRTTPAVDGSPVACVVDTGVNRGHPLLAHSLAAEDMHACDPAWGTDDHEGHGTEMAGLALYGDVRAALESDGAILLRHRLESVKIWPRTGQNDPDLYAAITAEAVSRSEVQAPNRRRVFSLATTAPPDPDPGTPTLWSAAVDALAAGRQFDALNGELQYIDESSAAAHRLFIVSAGNVREHQAEYMDRCELEPIEDPAQAWNALTVGGFTDLVDVEASGADFEGWSVLSPGGDLSPISRTSVAFARAWPIKPEVVLEAGNVAMSGQGTDFDSPDSLQLLTTDRNVAVRFSTANGTSASAALAAHLAAAISAEYPAFWPETVRALIVHAAEWTQQMRAEIDAVGANKTQREARVRRYGFGVPTLDRCLRSAANALTLVVQDTIRPFQNGKLREMHVHELPWPTEALASLGETPVRLRATLSYFIEPNPTRRGRRQRFRYASHGLRFELKPALETNEVFRKRINKRALDEEENRPTGDGDAEGWFLGSNARNRGSLHSDIWEGTAVELASRGRIAVYPVTGWWKELRARDRSGLGARYSLLISIETQVESVDLWTPVAAQVEVPITIET